MDVARKESRCPITRRRLRASKAAAFVIGCLATAMLYTFYLDPATEADILQAIDEFGFISPYLINCHWPLVLTFFSRLRKAANKFILLYCIMRYSNWINSLAEFEKSLLFIFEKKNYYIAKDELKQSSQAWLMMFQVLSTVNGGVVHQCS